MGSIGSAQVGPWFPVETPVGGGQLLNPDPISNASFGFSLSLSNDRLAVGAFGDNEVYIFEIGPASGLWQPGQTNSSVAGQLPTLAGWFGWSVSLFEDVLAVGAPEDWPGGAPFSGSTHIFQRDVSTGQWFPADMGPLGGNLPGQVLGPNPSDVEGFGASVSLSDDLMVIGANGIVVGGFDYAGGVYIYQRSAVAGPWQLMQSIYDPDPQTFNMFSNSVELSDDVLVVAKAFDEIGNFVDTGSLYLYGPEGFFIRGDCNGDGAFNIADAIKLLSYLFSGGLLPACLDSCDGNDDGNLNLADAATLLNELFLPGSPPIPAPDAVCSVDPTDDPLNCGEYNCP